MRILVTGGAGFIGSNFIHLALGERDDWEIVNLDKLTYAGNLENLKDVEDDSRYRFVKGDICDEQVVAEAVQGCDVVVITGGLGCAPVISVVNFIIQRRDKFGHLTIMQGVKLPNDLLWRDKYEHWSTIPDTQVYLAANEIEGDWPWHVGQVTELFDSMRITDNTMVMMCGPEGMMRACIHELHMRQVSDERIYLSMERNMQCGLGRCGHCQFGSHFICRQGPVFSLAAVRTYLGRKGY